MSTTIDFRAQAEEFAQWLVSMQGKGRRKFSSKTKVSGTCPKPGHEDKHPSFGYDIERDAYACSCSSGKGSELMAVLGWKSAKNGNGAVVHFSKPAPFVPPPARAPDDVYPYANGNRKLKWRTPGQKSAIQWRHESGKVGMEGDPGIYRLDEVIASTALVVHASESESDADALVGLGLAAIATPHGASSPWREFPAALAGRQLVVWEHQDDPGRKYAAAMVSVAVTAGCDATIARPAKGNKDVRDWIAAGATADDLVKTATAALVDFPLAEPADELLAADLPPPNYVIQPIAIRENLTLIQGEPKAGKSVITLYLAACAALGIWPAGRWSVPRPARVLYMTWEDGRRRIQKRLRQFIYGLGDAFKPITSVPNLLFYSKSKGKFKAPRIRLEEPAGRALLKKIIIAHKAELVVLDTLSHLKAVDENAVEKMQPVMDALTDLTEETGASIIINHHTGKESKGNSRSTTYRSRGSSVIPAAPDVILHLGDRGKANLTPCHMISREDEGDEFILEYLPEGKEVIRFKLTDSDDDTANNDDDGRKYGTRKLIIENLSTICQSDPYGASRTVISKTCKISTSAAIRHLEELAEQGSIQKKRVDTLNGPAWRYAPISHQFPTSKEGS